MANCGEGPTTHLCGLSSNALYEIKYFDFNALKHCFTAVFFSGTMLGFVDNLKHRFWSDVSLGTEVLFAPHV